MSRYTTSEIVLAERYVFVLGCVSHAAQVVEEGDRPHLWDKLGQLATAAQHLRGYLSTEPDPDGLAGYQPPRGVWPQVVRTAVAEFSRYYRAATLLHPADRDQRGGEPG